MFSLGRKKREKNLEKKVGEMDAELLSGKDYGDTRLVEQHVVERLEQMIELTREAEDEKAEYRMVTAYLNDMQRLEELPEEERKRIADIAANVVQLNAARTEFLNSAKKLSDAQFAQLEQQEAQIPDAIKRFTANEVYQDTLKRDMKYLEREKSEWVLRREYLEHQVRRFKNLLYVLIGIAATAAVLLGILQLVLEKDFYYGWMGIIFVTAAAVGGIYLKVQNDLSEITAAERSQNRAIALQNKVKIKYVNVTNAVDYAREKYHVNSAAELNQQWVYYLEAVREREKYQRTNEDLEYFNGRLVRMLAKYQLYDAQVWVTQAAALVDPKEMVEVRHGLINRRQKLRGRIEYNLDIVNGLKEETRKLLDKVGEMRPQVEQILDTVERLSENG